jgi:hypothetical protein
MPYFEASAKLNKNIDALMQHLMEEVYKKMFNDPNEERMKSVIVRRTDKKASEKGGKKSKCC